MAHHARMIPSLMPASLDAFGAHSNGNSSLPIVVLLTCLGGRIPLVADACHGETSRAALSALLLSGTYDGRLVFAHAAADDFPIAELELTTSQLPALIVLDGEGLYYDTATRSKLSGPDDATLVSSWLAAFCDAYLIGNLALTNRSPPLPLEVSPTWLPPRSVHVLSQTLEADLMATGRCTLLLVHDSSLTAEGLTSDELWRWDELAVSMAHSGPLDPSGVPRTIFPPKNAPPLLQLDLARSGLAPSSTLGERLAQSDLPAFFAVTNYYPGFVYTPVLAKSVRSMAALMQWAFTHLRSASCTRPVPDDTSADMAEAAADPGAVPSPPPPSPPPGLASRSPAEQPHAWLWAFVESGVPTVQHALHYQLRHRLETRVKFAALQAAGDHDHDAAYYHEHAADYPPPSFTSAEWLDSNDSAVRYLLQCAASWGSVRPHHAAFPNEEDVGRSAGATMAAARQRLALVRAAQLRSVAKRAWHEEHMLQ